MCHGSNVLLVSELVKKMGKEMSGFLRQLGVFQLSGSSRRDF